MYRHFGVERVLLPRTGNDAASHLGDARQMGRVGLRGHFGGHGMGRARVLAGLVETMRKHVCINIGHIIPLKFWPLLVSDIGRLGIEQSGNSRPLSSSVS